MKKHNQTKQVSLRWFGLPRVFPYLRAYRFYYPVMIIMALCGTVADICLPLFQQYALNHFVGQGVLDTLGVFILCYVLMLLFQMTVNFISTYIGSCIELWVGRDLRQSAFNHLQTLSFSFFNQNSVGYLHAPAFLSVAPGGFEAEICCAGKKAVSDYIADIEARTRDKTVAKKETDMIPSLQLVNEAYARGIKFLKPSLTKSHSTRFLPEDGAIRVPFNSMAGLGDSAANAIYEACSQGEILSVEDLRTKAEIGKGVIEIMRRNGVFEDVSETNQLDLFGSTVSADTSPAPEQKKKPAKKADPEDDAKDDQISMF